MQHKRLFPLVAVLLCCLLLLGGCGGGGAASSGATSSTTSGGNTAADETTGAFVERRVGFDIEDANVDWHGLEPRSDGSLLLTGLDWANKTAVAATSTDGRAWTEIDTGVPTGALNALPAGSQMLSTQTPDGSWWMVSLPVYPAPANADYVSGISDENGNPIEPDPTANIALHRAAAGSEAEKVSVALFDEYFEEGGERLGLAGICQTIDGNIVLELYEYYEMRREICLVLDGSTGEEVCRIELPHGQASVFHSTIHEDKIYFADYNSPRVSVFSLETGAEETGFTLPETLGESAMFSITPNGDFCSLSSGGIQQVTPGGTLVQQMVEGLGYAFSSPEFYPNAFLALGDSYLMTAATGSGSSALWLYEWDPDASSDPADALLVWAMEESLIVRATLSEYMEQYPDKDIRVEYGRSKDDTAQTSEDIIRTLNTRLLSEAPPDVLILDGLPVESYIERGILEDLTGKVDISGCYPNLMEAYVRDGKAYGYPTLFKMPAFFCRDDDPHAGGLEDLAQLADIAQDKNAIHFGGWEDLFETLYAADSARIFPGGKAVDEDALRAFLAATSAIVQAQGLTGDIEYIHGGYSNPDIMPRQGLSAYIEGTFAAPGEETFRYAADILREPVNAKVMFLNANHAITPLPGKGWLPVCAAGVPTGAPHKEDAFRFVEMLLAEESIHTLQMEQGFSVKQGMHQAFFEKGSDEDDSGKAREFDWDGLIGAYEAPAVTEAVLQDKLYEQAQRLYAGTQSLDDTVAGVLHGTELYFAERT